MSKLLIPLMVTVGLSYVANSFAFIDSPKKKGSLQFEQQRFDTGTIMRGDIVRKTFTFRNTGSGPVWLRALHSGCSCTIVSTGEKNYFGSGESGAVVVEFDSKDQLGRFNHSVTVLTSNARSNHYILRLKGKIDSSVNASPPIADFGEIPRSKLATTALTTKIKTKNGVKISDIQFPEDVLTVTHFKSNRESTLSIQPHASLKPGKYFEKIVVKNTSNHLPEMEIPVAFQVE